MCRSAGNHLDFSQLNSHSPWCFFQGKVFNIKNSSFHLLPVSTKHQNVLLDENDSNEREKSNIIQYVDFLIVISLQIPTFFVTISFFAFLQIMEKCWKL